MKKSEIENFEFLLDEYEPLEGINTNNTDYDVSPYVDYVSVDVEISQEQEEMLNNKEYYDKLELHFAQYLESKLGVDNWYYNVEITTWEQDDKYYASYKVKHLKM